MRLKSLEIKGFKSFADKTVILLDNPITGIVGPNGCGKSNIIDAIRWVIGEHKIKSLRSDSLEDLIFNGSKSRAASGMAEVSLTFENTRNLLPTEFTTVTITRKFYRNGDSEYRLNDVPCRLKDIHNLFLDTGVSNDSYAIIELAMVDDIIKDKEGSRRRMLEQAAGISVYKARKKEAKQKLESTEQDISRIEDLLFEISNNLRSLESQAKKAEKYYQIKQDYKDISIELAKASLTDFNAKYQDLNRQIEAETDRKTAMDAALAGDEAEIQANKVTLTSQEQELNAAQRRFNELQNRIRQLENEKKLAAQRLNYLQEREDAINRFLEGAHAQLSQIEALIALGNDKLAQGNHHLEKTTEILAALKAERDEKRNIFETRRKVRDEQQQTLFNLQRQLFEIEKKVAVSDSGIQNAQKNIAQAQEEALLREQQITKLQQEKADQQSLLVAKEQEYTAFKEQQEALIKQTEAAQQEHENIRNLSAEQNRKADAKNNEYALLKSMVDSLEGFPESIKFLKKSPSWQVEAPLLSDIFSVEPDYRKALENALDAYLNYYVVATESDAMAAISLLDKNRKGKANFFILNNISPTLPPPAQPLNRKGLTPALAVVKFDARYQALARQLLSSIYIAEETADLNIPLGPYMVAVNKSGQLKKGPFTLGGGFVGLFEGNKIGRAKKLEALQKEKEALQKEKETLTQRLQQSQAQINALKQQRDDRRMNLLQQELNNLKARSYGFENKIEQLQSIHLAAIKKKEQQEQQLQQALAHTGSHRETLQTLQGNMEEAQKEAAAAQLAFNAAEAAFNRINQKLNTETVAFTRQQSQQEQQQQEIAFRQKQLDDLRKQIADNRKQLQETSLQISETNGKLHFGDDELVEQLKKKERDEKGLSEMERTYYNFRNAIAEHESKISRQRKEREMSEQLLTQLKDKLSEMKLQLTSLKERLQVEFKVDLDSILDEDRTTDLGMDELNTEAERLKKRLDNIGDINPTAIEAFQEMKNRHDFIQDQKQDLETAKDNLLKTINEVENTANTRFKETFDKVRENFIHVFKALFTEEDNADLSLTDPEDMAETNIEIFAQPKGKRPSTLTQLSGGEKTLTSTAYLFAIYLIKPAPFCILDEVDAPLDDANVGKFTGMIRQFSDKSQFIMITHNKQAMASVDVIYGVTMQEAGVSKIVPVDFKSLKN